MRAYRGLQRIKKDFCAGKVGRSAVKAQAANYVKSAQAAGKTKADAEKTARRVLSSGCKMSSAIQGRRKKTATKRRTTGTKRRTTTARRR